MNSSTPPRASIPHWLWRFRYFSLVAAAALLLWNLNYAPIWNPDEGRYVSASLEMISPLDGSAPDWVVPHLNTLPRLNKPPLVYWCAATFFKLLGPSVAGARLVSAIAAIGVLLILWRMGTVMFGEKTGILAALVWVTCALPFTLARMLSTDMLLAFSMALAMLGIYKVTSPQKNGWETLTAISIAGMGLGLAMLAKGPVGVVLPIAILVIWLIAIQLKNSRLENPPQYALRALRQIPMAFLVAGLVAAPWYLAIGRSHPEFLGKFLFGENVARLTGSTFYHDAKPVWLYIPVLIVGLLPWTLMLWPALKRFVTSLFSPPQTEADTATFDEQTAARWFLWLWALAVIVLFSISKTKLVTYILPAMPPLALLIAAAFTSRSDVKALRLSVSLTAVLLGFLALLLPILFLTPKLLANKIVPRQESLPYMALMSLTLVIGVLSLWRALRSQETSAFADRAAATLIVTGAVLFMALTSFMGRVSPYEDVSPLLVRLQPYLQPGDKIVQFKTFQPAAMFYTNAPSTIVDFVNTSGLEEGEFKTSRFFPRDQKVLRDLFASPHRIYILVRWKHAHWPTIPAHHLIAANNDYRLLSNRPAPKGFAFDFVAPGKRNRVLSPACQALSPEC